MRDAVDAFIAYPSHWRRALLMLLAAGFVVMGLWMVGAFGSVPVSRRYGYWETLAAGWLCLIFFGFIALAWVPKLFETGEQLRIDRSGVSYSLWSTQTIPWSQITNVTTWSLNGTNAIIVHLRDPSKYPGKGLIGLLAGVNRKLSGGDISISLTGTDRTFDEAMTAIERYRRTN